MKKEPELENIKCFMLDMDGTFYLGNKLLPGAKEFINYISANNLDYLFLTNNSSKHAELYAEKIHKLGMDIPAEKIFTSGEATTIFLQKKIPQAKIYIVGTYALEYEFRKKDFQLVDEDPDAVVLGFDTTVTYQKFRKICDFIRDGKPYYATHPDLNCPTETGFMPDIGSFIALIEASTGRRPDIIVGKPNEYIVSAVVEKTGYGIDEIAMIGDRLYTDIALGKAGITTILMLSGETKKEEVANSQYKPDFIFENLLAFVKYLNQKSG